MSEYFVDEVRKLLQNFRFKAYWPNKPIKILELNTTIKEPEQVEIDIIAKIGAIGFLVEVTTQKDKNDEKIKKFIQKYRALKESALPKNKLINLFSGVPSDSIKIEEWRSIYVGTSVELVYNEITPDKFTDSEGLTIINIDDWNYITALKKAIGEFARFEFMSFLGLNPDEVERIDDTDQYFDFYIVEDRNITKESLKADLFLFAASPSFLLRTCRVFRFVGLSLSDAKHYYQRMLNARKLNVIREFIGDSSKRSFPTPITIALPPKVSVRKRDGKPKIAIPFKYGSLELIDGQHRLYAYAHSTISLKITNETKLLVNGIRFKSTNQDEIRNLTSRTFIDINREQMKVKTSLLYSISYDSMGDTSSKSLAGKIISLCNLNKYSPLHDLFESRTISRKSKLETQRISIVEVTNALAKIIERIRDTNSLQSQNVAKMLGEDTIPTEANELMEIVKKLMNKYFNRVKNVLSGDWTERTESVIFRSKYMAAFILLLQDSIEKGNNFTEIENWLSNISNNIKSTSEWKKSGISIPDDEQGQIFHKEREAIPSVKFGTGKILKGLLWYKNNTEIWPELGRISQNGE